MNRVNNKVISLTSIVPTVWALGLVSLFMDFSSELIMSILPLFMVYELGASMTIVGTIEGIAQAASLIIKLFSGILSDYMHRRKPLVLLGYGIAALTKPFFPLAHSVRVIFAARFADRIGKGIRGAPRDAIIGDVAPAGLRGAYFGFRQSMDSIGAFLGPLCATIGIFVFNNNIRMVLWLGVIPAIVSFLVLLFGVQEPKVHHDTQTQKTYRLSDMYALPMSYWQLVLVAGVFTVARFSEAFLLLKARSIGISLQYIPLVMVGMNGIYASAAYPAGIISDKIGRVRVIHIGILFLMVAHTIFAFAHTPWLFAWGMLFWGLHLAFTQGLFAAMVTDMTSSSLRATAYGIFNGISGVALFLSSTIAGLMWDNYGPQAPFFVGAVFTLSALGLFSGYLDRYKTN